MTPSIRLKRRSGPSGMRYEAVLEAESFSLDAAGTLCRGAEGIPIAEWRREELFAYQGGTLWHAFIDGDLVVDVGGMRLDCPRGLGIQRILREAPWAGPVSIDEIRVQRLDRGEVIASLDLRAPQPRWRTADGRASAETLWALPLGAASASAAEEDEPGGRLRPSQLAEGQKLVNMAGSATESSGR